MSTGTRDAGGWTLSSTLDVNGKSIHSRLVITDTTPGVHAFTWEVSEDGKTWQAIMRGTSTRSS